MTRAQAYRWLREKMSLSESETRFSRFSVARCTRAVLILKHHFPELRNVWDKLADDDIFG